MMNPARDVGKFASSNNYQTQKGILITFAIIGLLLFSGGLANKINTYFFDEEAIDNKIAAIAYHYLLIYMTIHYFFNLVFGILKNIKEITVLSLLTAGLYIFIVFTFDFVFPVGFSLFVIYKVNQTCDCIMNNKDQIITDFSDFYWWAHTYVWSMYESSVAILEKYRPQSEWLNNWLNSILLPLWQFAVQLFKLLLYISYAIWYVIATIVWLLLKIFELSAVVISNLVDGSSTPSLHQADFNASGSTSAAITGKIGVGFMLTLYIIVVLVIVVNRAIAENHE